MYTTSTIPTIILSLFLFLHLFSSFAFASPTCCLKPPPSARDEMPSSPPANSSGDGNGNGPMYEEVVITGWYPGWLASSFPPSKISWDKWTHMTYAFALTGADASSVVLNSDDERILPTFVQAAQSNGVKALISIGGWTGSRYFSTAVSTPENRSAFVEAITKLADTYKLDGIDFDWEYPNKQGIGCNIISPSDSANFLEFLKELKQHPIGGKLYLSAAASITPFMGPDGTPMSDVSEFAQYLNHLAVMNYDIWGSWSTGIGPNAPLDDSCAPTQAGSAISAIDAWKNAKFPANQMVLGIASYGHSFKVQNQGEFSLYSSFEKNSNPLLPADSGGADICGNPTGPVDNYDFSQMVTAGFLKDDGNPAEGITYMYDDCSQTPFVYNPTSGVVISYDDTKSMAAKGKFIEENGLKGFAMWQVAGDQRDMLLDAISGALDIQSTCS
ncbi:hypothetical protein AGABI2DRAFT_208965 [Agaricus bisporus var. bisporus H97]|uniref:hypothetical protein n=1 Tax=Agaricus bisporus var. bisporus (strain H97 / ATCC MYA-4626 / FGSC 10389) TaxID=936046 RepID=UPI00029F6EAF|nr:hypothetical protein AGABI2DRAFT_208965 [Agaricus bisporus var. bisporus H97]EKV44643.1 hypothetical protein AGABI2DRAFT_208965 [Agaricus bisporus var. bisporus H97]